MAEKSTFNINDVSILQDIDWKDVFEKHGLQSIEEPLPKRRKVDQKKGVASNKDIPCESDYVTLVHRVFHLVLDEEAKASFFATVSKRLSQNIELPVNVDFHIPRKDEIVSLGMSIKEEGSKDFISMSGLSSDLSKEAKADITWATKIRKHRKNKTKQPQFTQYDCKYVLELQQTGSRSRVTSLKLQLRMKIVAKAMNESTEESLALAKTDWWRLLAQGLPDGKPETKGAKELTARDFYTSAHIPDKNTHIPDSVQHPSLTCTLLPFQTRAVRWMLRKEGMDLQDGSQDLVKYNTEDLDEIPPTFFETKDKDGKKCYVSHILGFVSTNLKALNVGNGKMRGGLLAEEMGLGKTVELIALMALNPRPPSDEKIFLPKGDREIAPCSATLIITPPSILGQWATEIETHYPSLKVLVYTGMTNHRDQETEDIVKEILTCDVVLTTYYILSHEIWYTQPIPDRQLRYPKVYKVRRSPLIEISWWRVVLDEAQMIEGGVSNAACVAREIPRINPWAVSGTPVQKDIEDLFGILLFLGYGPFRGSGPLVKDINLRAWKKLVRSNHESFRSLFNGISLRHSKDIVRDEINLPPQRRVIVTVPFSQVEEQNYRQLFQQMCEDCGVDETGAPVVDDWKPEGETLEKMRAWLTRLRQTCLHPQAGERNRRAFGLKSGPLRTVEQVLDVMIDQHTNSLRNDEKALITSMIKRGQIYEYREDFEAALTVWKAALVEVQRVVGECREALAEEMEKQPHPEPAAGDTKRKGKRRRVDEEDSGIEYDEDDNEDQAVDVPRTSALRNRIRSFLENEHACHFWIATAYYQLKTREEKGNPESAKIEGYTKLESDFYDRAKVARQELVLETRTKAVKLIDTLKRKISTQTFTEIPEIVPPASHGGIETHAALEAIEGLAVGLNEQANTLDEWRETLIQLLTKRLIDEDDGQELQGNELEESVKQHEESFVYMVAIRALVADREEALTGLSDELVRSEVRRELDQPRDNQDLLRQLINKKESIKPELGLGTMRIHWNRLKTTTNALKNEQSHRAKMEHALAKEAQEKMKIIMSEQAKANANLSKELELFRKTTGARMEFYKQVQDISDTVEGINSENDPRHNSNFFVDNMLREEASLQLKITKAKSRGRYLSHLKVKGDNESPNCLICLSAYEIGVLTGCGHSFCKECIMMWWRQAHTCPICKLRLSLAELYQITYKPEEATMQQEQPNVSNELNSIQLSGTAPRIYENLENNILNEIKTIDLGFSFGSKIDMIMRHILWLKQNEPELKVVLFSQWLDVLEFIGTAMAELGIGFTRPELRGGVHLFKNDPNITCFLLHAKSQAAGLTLVNATHVFICEPLINVSLELQAISRVHRIGQHRPTTIWLYVVNGSVEQSVLELTTRRRIALMEGDKNPLQKQKEENPISDQKLDAANSLELQQGMGKLVEKGVGGGEKVGEEDLWDCLFGKGRTLLHSKEANDLVRREMMASAAENRIENNAGAGVGAGVAGSSRR